MSRASADIMDALHNLAATALTEELRRAMEAANQPRKVLNEDDKLVDNPDYQPLNPQLVDKALKMLKDNAITAPESNRATSDLAATLQDLDLDDPGMSLRPN